MKITLEIYDKEYSVETNDEDYLGDELKEIFSRILVVAGYPPTVIDIDDGGRFEYVADDEKVVKTESEQCQQMN